jgi:peptidoglycan/xylan/chitin deacetylase (PgdA/CDA1 family)
MAISRKFLGDVLFDGLYYSRALNFLQARRSGMGIIFMLHRVMPVGTPILATNLAASSAFLDETLGYIRHLGWDIVTLREGHRRLVEGRGGPNFVCFTFDDGYADALTVTLPIFRKHRAPMCVYVTTGLIDRTAFLWWPVLEQMLLTKDRVRFVADGVERELATTTLEQKRNAYQQFDPLISRRDVSAQLELMNLFDLNGIDPVAALDPMILTWKQAGELAADPLVEIGCHTVSHPALASLDYAEARRELSDARKTLQEKLQVPVSHLSYPYGTKNECGVREFQLAQELGFQTATTTRRGNVFPAHKDHLTALPRVNIPGADSASLRFIRKCLFGGSPWPNYAPEPIVD